MKKYLIVGGVAGGASATARLRRNDESAEIILFERSSYISYANCGLPYYIGGVISEREKLFVQTAENFAQRFNVDVRTSSEVLSLDCKAQKLTAVDLKTGKKYEEHYDKLVLSPGAVPIKQSLAGADEEGVFYLRDVEDTDRIDSFLKSRRPQSAVIIGAGYIGMEMTENLQRVCSEVTLIEMTDRILSFFDFEFSAALYRHIKAHGVNVLLNERVTALERDERSGSLRVVSASGKETCGDIVVFAAGVRPDTEWLKESGLQLSENGSIIVNQYLQTSDKNVYAVGDAVQTKHRLLNRGMNAFLAGPANKQGRIAADNITGNNRVINKGFFGTSIIKVFELTAGFIGASESELQKQKIEYLTAMIHGSSSAGYYPGARPLSLKICFGAQNGEILNAQIIGYTGVDKRLDVVSALIQNNGTIYDLTEFEHSYAPPYSSARDPLTIIGYVAENMLQKKVESIRWQELSAFRNRNALFIDVRYKEEYEHCTIPGSINIPLDELRGRLTEIPSEREIVLFCLVGRRAYLACRILKQSGYQKVYNLSGGFKTYQFVYCRDEKKDIYEEEIIKADDDLYPVCGGGGCPYSY